MASSSFSPFFFFFFFSLIFLILSSTSSQQLSNNACYSSIISFGDSLADTGNLIHLETHSELSRTCGLPPYGETYFHHPTGRCSNGRLIIDFIAESLGLPLVPPYVGGDNVNGRNFRDGVNFAVAGATALDFEYLAKRGIHNPFTNVSLGTELEWFKRLLPSFCSTSSDCKEFLQSSLILMGEIGGNDYNYALFVRRKDKAKSLVSPVINAITSTITELIELGAVTFVVPGNLPIGCSAAYLARYADPDKGKYDPETGCLIWLNQFAEYHNELLQTALHQIQVRYPHANIIYADYYNAAMQIYRSPSYYGFTRGALKACLIPSSKRSSLSSTVCDEPDFYVSWDGLHLTEAAYRWIFKGLFEGPYTSPQFISFCPLSTLSAGTNCSSPSISGSYVSQ